MAANLLLLGGTSEASALAGALASLGVRATVSLAGRVAQPRALPLPVRIGGFGGVAGLVDYLRAEHITHVVDATHPFAAQMSRNAIAACAEAGLPLIALTRAPWVAEHGDDWTRVADMAGAVAALERPAQRVFLAVGRMHLDDFIAQPQHHYVLRLVDAPETPPLPDCTVIVDRGPFSLENDLALLRDHAVDLVVSKNSGGTGAYAKIEAARALGLPVIMIDRRTIPPRIEAHTVADIMAWLDHPATERGV